MIITLCYEHGIAIPTLEHQNLKYASKHIVLVILRHLHIFLKAISSVHKMPEILPQNFHHVLLHLDNNVLFRVVL